MTEFTRRLLFTDAPTAGLVCGAYCYQTPLVNDGDRPSGGGQRVTPEPTGGGSPTQASMQPALCRGPRTLDTRHSHVVPLSSADRWLTHSSHG